ncbi:MAG: AMP-binding protein [Victivallaceae bacterium]|nr:AMP-binding protein [Victivallaceae bacterium]
MLETVSLYVVVLAIAALVVLFVLFCRTTTIKIIGWLMTHSFVRLRTFDTGNIPDSGPVLLVSNHISMIDLFLIQYVSKRRVQFLVRDFIFNSPFSGFFFKYVKALPVPGDQNKSKLVNHLLAVRNALERGEVVCVFPEKEISGNGNLMRFHLNLRVLTDGNTCNATILPMRIGMLHGRLLTRINDRWKLKLPQTLRTDFSIIVGNPVPVESSAFHVRQKISELGAEVESRPQPDEEPLHTAFVLRAKHHMFEKLFCDSINGKWTSNFEMLVMAIIMQKIVKERDLNRKHSAGYVGVLLPNCSKMTGLMLGILLCDKTPAVLNFSAGEDVAYESIRNIGASTVFSSKKFVEKLNWHPDKWTGDVKMLFLEDLMDLVNRHKLKAILTALFVPGRTIVRNLAPQSCHNTHTNAIILFSSGSTGKPKAVQLTHRNINCDIWSFMRMIYLTKKDRMVGNLPMFHAYGFTALFALPCQAAVPVVYNLSPLNADEIVKSIEKYKLTILTATPTFIQKYMRRATKEQLKSLRLIVAGAEKLRKELIDSFLKLTGKRIIEGYGCTELSPITTVNFNNSIFDIGADSNHPGSIGCPLPGIHIRIVDDNGEEIEPGAGNDNEQEGHMQVKAGIVTKGYLINADGDTKQVTKDGYYDTGDIARFDIDGYLYITGRASRFSKIGGEMVPHEKIEGIIGEFRGSEVLEAAVTGCPDSRKGERLLVFYTPDDLDPEEIIEHIRSLNVPNIWIPKKDDFIKVSAIPLLGSGKLDLRKLKEMADRVSAGGHP